MPERVRWGILGCANIAKKRFMPGVAASSNGTLAAVASRDLGRAQEAARPYPGARALGSYEELLAAKDVDAVYIGLPNSLHAQWTKKAADAGKAVLCEKPLASTADEAAEMVRYCSDRGVPLMEAFMYRFHPQHAYVRQAIDGGHIGDVRFVRAAFTFMLEPFPVANVRLNADLAGGALMDVGCYCVDAAHMLFGEPATWASAQWDFRPEFGVEVSLAGILGFSDGRTAVFDCGFRATGQGLYNVAGTAGSIECANAFVPQSAVRVSVESGGQRRDEQIGAVDQYALEAEAFAAALLARTPVPLAPSGAVEMLRSIEALRRSAQEGGRREAI
jgi:predicted dehydrogenase